MPRYHDDDEDHIDMRPLLRLMVWGTCAIVGIGATVMAGRSDVGTARAKVAFATFRAAPGDVVNHPNDMLANRPATPDKDEQRLAEQVRALTADRDRLAERVATLEHNLNDLTGSIARLPAANSGAANAAAPNNGGANATPPNGGASAAPNTADSNGSAANSAPPQEKADAPAPAVAEATTPPASPAQVANADDDQAPTAAVPAAPQPGVGLPADVPLPRPGPLATIQSYVNSTAPLPATAPQRRVAAVNRDVAPAAAGGSLAIDLGSATNINTLRAHWGAVKAAHGGMLAGLQPLVSVRQSTRPGFTEFHLVAGPVTDADAVAHLCAALTSVRVPCRPSTYNGQRLDLR